MELLALHKAMKKPPRSDERDGALFCGTVSINADTSQVLGSITGINQRFTAPEDCIMQGSIKLSPDRYLNCYLQLNGATIFTASNANSYSPTDMTGSVNKFYIPQGSVITSHETRYQGSTQATWNIKFYRIAS